MSLDKTTHRKLFHGLGLLLYTPMHAMVLEDRRVFELLMLSQNLVTVFFIYIELARFINRDNKLGHYLSLPFTPFCDNRERKPE